MIAFLITLLILAIAILFSPKSFETEKVSAYECGFEPFNDSRGTYNTHFYVIAILFIIFDLEIAYLFPWAKNLHGVGFWGFWSALFFLAILTLGFVYEWKKGALIWLEKKNEWVMLSYGFSYNTKSAESLFNSNSFIKSLDAADINSFKFIIPEFLFILLLAVALLWGVYKESQLNHNFVSGFYTSYILKNGIFFLAGIYFIQICYWFVNPYSIKLFNNFIIIDLYGSILKFMLLFLGGILFICMQPWTFERYQNNKTPWEDSLLMGFALFFMICMLSAFDLISMYISMEGLALTLYVLAASDFSVKGSLESSVKYFSLGVIASGAIIFGILLIYLLVGSTNFLKIWYYLGELHNYDYTNHNWYYQKLFLKDIELLWSIPLILLVWGFLFKLAAYPNNVWAPEVYEGSSMPVTAFFAIPVKFTFVGVFIKLGSFLFGELQSVWVPLLSLAAAGSLIIGCFGALSTDKVKSFLAYASINHMGFMLMGLSSASFKGLSNVWTYLLVYLAMNLIIFAILLNTRSSSTGKCIVYITDFQYLSTWSKPLSLLATVVWLSMAGIPPFAGFFSKYYIFLSAIEASSYSLVFVAIFTSIVSTFYYLRFIKIIWFSFQQPSEVHGGGWNFRNEKVSYLFAYGPLNLIMVVLASFIVFFGFIVNYVEIFSDALTFSSMISFNIITKF